MKRKTQKSLNELVTIRKTLTYKDYKKAYINSKIKAFSVDLLKIRL